MKNPKVSVIIPVYNGERYLAECIDSVIKQTFSDIEIIIINDGSSDSTDDISRRYEIKDRRIRYINQENIGVSKTRQKGVSVAESPYIFFLDADDYLEPDCLKELYLSVRDNDADVACCSVYDWENGVIKYKHLYQDAVLNDKKRFLEDFFCQKRYTCTLWGKLYKKDLFDNLDFPKMKYGEDSYIVTSLFQKSTQINLISKVGYNYRLIPTSATNTLSDYRKSFDLMHLARHVYLVCKDTSMQLVEKAETRYIDSIRTYIYSATKNVDLALNEKELVKIYFDDVRSFSNLNFKIRMIMNIYMISPRLYTFIFNLGRTK